MRRRKKLDPQILRTRYAAGESTVTLGRAFRVDHETIRRCLLKVGVVLRANGVAPGSKHWNWRGGRKHDSEGYIKILSPEHPFCDANGYVYEHRLNMERVLNRYLTKKEEVHHRNLDRADNREENLMLFASETEHRRFHRELRKLQKISSPAFCSECPSEWTRKELGSLQ
jgi:hypothetical protein